MPVSWIRDTRGAALVEAALVLPVLLTLVFGIADFALYLWQLNSVQKSVQLGVRRAIVSDPVAVGAGLTELESFDYWYGRPLGASCERSADGTSACPTFRVVCRSPDGCVCEVGTCGYSLSEVNLSPILETMQAVLPRLARNNLEISYATNYLGYVGRPMPAKVDVGIRIVGLTHDVLFMGDILGRALALTASATLPSESLRSIAAND